MLTKTKTLLFFNSRNIENFQLLLQKTKKLIL